MDESPLPWKVIEDGMEFRIVDALGEPVIFGNVNRGIEWDDPNVPALLRQAVELLNQAAIDAKG